MHLYANSTHCMESLSAFTEQRVLYHRGCLPPFIKGLGNIQASDFSDSGKIVPLALGHAMSMQMAEVY